MCNRVVRERKRGRIEWLAMGLRRSESLETRDESLKFA